MAHMRYFSDLNGDPHGFDADDPAQLALMDAIAVANSWAEITGSWPPAPSESDKIKDQIVALEATVTPRRLREAALGADGGWLKNLDDQIVALRAKLTS